MSTFTGESPSSWSQLRMESDRGDAVKLFRLYRAQNAGMLIAVEEPANVVNFRTSGSSAPPDILPRQ